MTATQTFTCNICGEESTRICARCTKDTCNNHLCEKCLRCSDCCECEIVRDESVRPVVRPPAVEEPVGHVPDLPSPTLEVPPEVAEEGAPVPQDSLVEAEPEQASADPGMAPPEPSSEPSDEQFTNADPSSEITGEEPSS